MATAIHGTDYLSFFRLYKDRETEDASKMRFLTESTISKEKESDTRATKDGPLSSVTDGESSADFTSIAWREDDGTLAYWKKLERAFDDNELVEFWNVDIKSGEEGRDLDCTYHRGYFTSFEISAPADGQVELSYTYTINGRGVSGKDTLTEEQLKAVRSAQYEYTSLKAVGPAV